MLDARNSSLQKGQDRQALPHLLLMVCMYYLCTAAGMPIQRRRPLWSSYKCASQTTIFEVGMTELRRAHVEAAVQAVSLLSQLAAVTTTPVKDVSGG